MSVTSQPAATGRVSGCAVITIKQFNHCLSVKVDVVLKTNPVVVVRKGIFIQKKTLVSLFVFVFN